MIIIKIWGNKWILISLSYCTQSPIKILDGESRVKEIINEENRRWNENFIYEIFKEYEVELIYSMPISKMGVEDKLKWGHTKIGMSSIKSVYYVESTRRRTIKGESSLQNYADARWKRIREMNVQGVVKTLLMEGKKWHPFNKKKPIPS